MGVNLDDIIGNKKQDILVDKTKRTMNFLLIGVVVVIVLIAIVAIRMMMRSSEIKTVQEAAMITRDAEKISNAIVKRYAESKQTNNPSLLIGDRQDTDSMINSKRYVQLVCGGNELSFMYGYYYLNKDQVSSLINNAPLELPSEYVVNYSTGEVVNLKGVKWKGKTYYEVDDLSAIARNEVPPCDNTITINSPDDMKKFAQYPNAIYRLNRDIDMAAFNGGNGWTPIPVFSGKFYGRGYKIRNLKINNSSLDHAGLFGTITADALIDNLVLENIDVAGGDFVGAIAGSCSGRISNCVVTGNVYSTGRYAGGLFGNFEGTAQNIKSGVKVRGAQYVGGFAGQVTGGTILQCCVKGDNLTVTGNEDNIGGFIGLVQSNRDISITESCAVATISGVERVGGLIGRINASDSMYQILIENCYSQGSITKCDKSAGGFVGEISSVGRSNINLNYNYTTCKPTPSVREARGGFVGSVAAQSEPSVKYCYWERQQVTDSALSENGVGYQQDNTVIFDPLSPEAIRLQTSFSGWDSVIKYWRFDNKTAPILSWE